MAATDGKYWDRYLEPLRQLAQAIPDGTPERWQQISAALPPKQSGQRPTPHACRLKYSQAGPGAYPPHATPLGSITMPEPVVPAEPVAADHPALRSLERRLNDTQNENRQLRAKLKEADADRSIYEQLAAVVRRETQPLLPQKVARIPASRSKYLVDGIAVLTDEHADATVTGPSTWGLEVYDFDVFRARLMRWAEVIVGYIVDYLPRHQFERLWVFGLGDSVNGDIHDHKYRNHFANSLKAALATGDAEAEALAWIHQQTGVPLHMVKVSGNHPRGTKRKDYDGPHDNLDFLVATQIATRLSGYAESGAITVHAPESWTAYVDVRGKICALNHGDDVIGFAGIPWYGFSRKHNRVQAMLARHAQRVDYFFHGHYHTDMTLNENASRSIHSGAFTLTDPYAAEKVSACGEPTQPLIVVDDKPGERARVLDIPIFMRDPERESQLRAGEWEPVFGRRTILDVVRGGDGQADHGEFPLIRALA